MLAFFVVSIQVKSATDLQLNFAGEYKFHYDMVPVVGGTGGSLGCMVFLDFSFLALIALVGTLPYIY